MNPSTTFRAGLLLFFLLVGSALFYVLVALWQDLVLLVAGVRDHVLVGVTLLSLFLFLREISR